MLFADEGVEGGVHCGANGYDAERAIRAGVAGRLGVAHEVIPPEEGAFVHVKVLGPRTAVACVGSVVMAATCKPRTRTPSSIQMYHSIALTMTTMVFISMYNGTVPCSVHCASDRCSRTERVKQGENEQDMRSAPDWLAGPADITWSRLEPNERCTPKTPTSEQ